MKYIVILGDGMSDYPIEQLGGKTPLQAAATPTIDFLAARSEVGLARTIPDEMPPGSDTANLAVMGYNPREFYTGRSPFEAASMGVLLDDTDVAFRCNLVTLSGEQPFAAKTMVDYCAEEISSAEAARIIESVNEALGTEALRFYPGVSYRNLLTWKDAPDGFRLTPPHDITGRPIRDHLPKGPHAEVILGLMAASATFLADHPVNRERVAQGLRPANSIWIWGEGKKPRLSSFAEKYGVQGSVISAVDLVKGIGVCAGLRVVEVPGATGNIHTNFVGKAMAAVQELKNGQDFVYVHLEAPDECGHRYEIANKVRSIELIDEKVVQVILEQMEGLGEPFRMLLLPDHPTPLSLRTHTHDPVPYLLYDSTAPKNAPGQTYDEATAERTGVMVDEGYRLMDRFLRRM